jgi:hypothetical protein
MRLCGIGIGIGSIPWDLGRIYSNLSVPCIAYTTTYNYTFTYSYFIQFIALIWGLWILGLLLEKEFVGSILAPFH